MDRFQTQYFIEKHFKKIMNAYETYIKATINSGSVEDIFDIAEDILFIKEFRKIGWDINSIWLKEPKDKEKSENTEEIGEKGEQE